MIMAPLTDDEFVRLRAYALWVEEGQPEGREHIHWSHARRELERHASRPERTLDGHRSPQQSGQNQKEEQR
jgi:hypothetical protein